MQLRDESVSKAPARTVLPRFWLPTDAWVRVLLVPVLAFIALSGNTSYLADFWHHLARGRVIVEEGRLLDHDVFTFTVPGESFQDVNWLSQVVYFALYEQGGLPLVRVVNALLTALTLGFLVRLCARLSGSLVAAMVIGIAIFLGLWQVLTIRPQTFSLLLFVLLFDVLDRSERRPWLLVIPPVMLGLWANLHGAFPAGLILVGGFLFTQAVLAWKRGRLMDDQRWRHLAACLAACLVATLINPYGWNIYFYVGMTSNRAAQRRIDEWVPPTLDQGIGVAFFLSLILLAALVSVNLKRRTYGLGWRDVVLALCFLPLAAGSVRMVAWWLLIIAPTAAVLLAGLLPARQTSDNQPTLGAALTCAGLLVMAAFSLPGLQAYNPLIAFRLTDQVEHNLDEVLERLVQHKDTGRVFTRFEWAEYLTWAASPRFPVFMDGRIEIYPDKVWQEYETVTTGGADWARIIDHYNVDVLVLDSDYHTRTGLMAKVENAPRWRRVIQVKSAVLYIRQDHGAD